MKKDKELKDVKKEIEKINNEHREYIKRANAYVAQSSKLILDAMGVKNEN